MVASETVEVSTADLLLDSQNPRIVDSPSTQQAIALALAKQQGAKIIELAEDIATSGLDPLVLPGIVATDDKKKRYVIVEGNRRLLALKALETPTLISSELSSGDRSRLNKAATAYAKNPIETIACALFESRDDAVRWIRLRHTGANEGKGLVEWGSDEKDRFEERNGGKRSLARQVLDFYDKHGSPESGISSTKKISTNVTRLLESPSVRKRLGIEVSGGVIYSQFPTAEVAKGISKIVNDLRSNRVRVKDIYDASDRQTYAKGIRPKDLPDQAKRLPKPRPLDDLTQGKASKSSPPGRKPRPTPPLRTALIPRSCNLNIPPPRINAIYVELADLSIEKYPNAASVLLRVFLELSIDHYGTAESIISESDKRSRTLAARLKVVAAYLRKKGLIDQQLEIAIKKVADSNKALACSTLVFNQYAHNPYTHPQPSDLRSSWDELQPLMEILWR